MQVQRAKVYLLIALKQFTHSTGVTQAQRDVLSKGLTCNGAKLLDVPCSDGERISPSDLVPNGFQLLMNAAKRKRSGAEGGAHSSSKRGSGVAIVSKKVIVSVFLSPLNEN